MDFELACLWLILTLIVCIFAVDNGWRGAKWAAQKLGRWIGRVVATWIWGSGRPR